MFPLKVKIAAAVKLSDVAVPTFVVKLPATVKALAIKVFTTDPEVPENMRFP